MSLEEAIQYVENGLIEKGIAAIKDTIKHSDDETKYNAVLLLQQWGLVQEAYDIAEGLTKIYPEESNITLTLSELLIDMDKEDDAIDLLLQIQERDEAYLSAQLLLADLYEMQGLDEVAEGKLLQAEKLAPKEPIITFALAEFYLGTGQASKAISKYKVVLNAKGLAHENVKLKLAEAMTLNGQFEDAMPYFKSGLEQNKTLDGLFGYGMTAHQLEKYSVVISALEELKELDPQYSTLYPILANAYKEEGAIEESLKVLIEGIKVDEHNLRLYLEAAKLSFQLSSDEKALEYLNYLLGIDPDNLEALRMIVDYYEKEEQYEDIIDVLKNTEHDDPNLMWALANAYVQEDEIEAALPYYKEAHPNFCNNSTFLQQYGECYLQLGQNQKALEFFNEALKIDPLNDDLIAFIERLNFSMEN